MLIIMIHQLKELSSFLIECSSNVIKTYLMSNINKDDFVEFESRILSHPVRVQNTKTTTTPANSFFSNGLQTADRLQVVDTMALGLTIGTTFGNRALTTTTADPNSVDDKA